MVVVMYARAFRRFRLMVVGAVLAACGRSGLEARPANLGPGEDSGIRQDGGRRDDSATASTPDASFTKDALVVFTADSRLSTCGNGRLDPGEECDDGNTQAGDGCSSLCKVECDFMCGCGDPTQVCVALVVCGDGIRSSSEGCDDANTNDGDGCSANCQVEAHWVCVVPGKRCRPICGDGIVSGGEACDDGNTVAGDGCGENCLVEGEGLFCGDGIESGAEECDDGFSNGSDVYGACTSHCKYSRCGDGIVNGPEECDLGDAQNQADYGEVQGCTRRCTRPHYCGDGIVDSDHGEMCDLGTKGNGGSYCTRNCVMVID